jgi:hypothetical protein
MLVSIVALLTTQLSFQLTGAVPPLRTRLLMGAKILALAAPLAALGFVLFPRVDGPLWGLPDEAAAPAAACPTAWRRASSRTWRSRTSRPSA